MWKLSNSTRGFSTLPTFLLFGIYGDRKHYYEKLTLIPSGSATAVEEGDEEEDAFTAHDPLRGSREEKRKGIEEDEEK